jgi:hypothetical protein
MLNMPMRAWRRGERWPGAGDGEPVIEDRCNGMKISR